MSLFQNVDLSKYFTASTLEALIRVLIIGVIGFIIIKLIVFVTSRAFRRSLSAQSLMVVKKGINYTGMSVLVLIILSELGVGLSAVLGAAGVLGVAFGIASRTSLSNFISGLFLVSEKTFEIGDLVRIGDKTGVVFSIDLLSVKLRTLDNLLIRVPNEIIISDHLTNITKFPVRRMDFDLKLCHGTDLTQVGEILKDIAMQNPLVLQEPEPLILFKGYGENSIEMLFAVWFLKTDFLKVKNSVFPEIDKRFGEAGIQIARAARLVQM